MIQIENNTDTNFTVIRAIAKEVWPIAYGAILSTEQLDYMMNMMYSIESLQKQSEEKQHHFILAKEDNDYLGFASYECNYNGTVKTKIHKIYIYTHQQGKGIGKLLIDSIAKEVKLQNQEALLLNVNRNNNALQFYQKLGFSIQYEENIDIGNDYFMEDFVMERPI